MDLRDALIDEISRTVADHPANRHPGTHEPFFDAPLVGFADASDPLFARYREIIGPFHWTPAQVFEAEHGRGAGARTVVCWVLPITAATRRSNRGEERMPSRRWAHTRHHGERFNDELRRRVVSFLRAHGARAVAPCLRPDWGVTDDPAAGLASSWSERHAAYAAGLGTFSLNDGLITERGIAHRVGSVVTDAAFPPTPRPSGTDHRGHCAFFAPEGCGVCIDRCPAGAVSARGHDKALCKRYTYGAVLDAVGEAYGVAVAGCGLCQTRVPCEERIPPAARKR